MDGVDVKCKTEDFSHGEDYNGNWESLSRALSRRCSYCNKMLIFKTYQCKQCRHRCHKKCSSSHNSSRRNSAQKLLTGDEHWSKVLQANEVNANLLLAPCCSAGSGPNASKHVVQQVCCQKAARRLSRSKSTNPHPNPKDGNIFTTLYNRFVQWVNKGENGPGGMPSGTSTPCSEFRSRSSSMNTGTRSGGGTTDDWQTATTDSDYVQRWCSSWSSDNGSELGSLYASSACSSLTMLSTSTATSGCPSPSSPGSPTLQSPTGSIVNTCTNGVGGVISNGVGVAGGGGGGGEGGFQHLLAVPPPTMRGFPSRTARNHMRRSSVAAGQVVMEAMKRRHSNLTSTVSCPSNEPATPSVLPAQQTPANVLTATWPPAGNHYATLESTLKDDEITEETSALDDSVFTNAESDHSNLSIEPGVADSLGECSIPYSALKFGKCLRTGHNHEIYKGQWHGEVIIHKYSHFDDEKVGKFWQEVSKLSKIRHENITLFMGACLELPHLAVVTSMRKGNSLYNELHLGVEKMTMHARVNIARQVAQGLGYLHHKGIVAKKLNSRNIYLEPRVKLCLLDHGMPEVARHRPGFGSVPRGHLTYVAPEMLQTLTVASPQLKAHWLYSTQTDVYAFGSVLYELISGHFPMKGSTPECIIWRVAVGHRQCLKHIKCNSALKTLIAKCWKQNPVERPTSIDINTQLQFNAALHKRHSSSEPDALNRFGQAHF